MVQIEWVNHASFVIRTGDIALISDPWLFGTAFDDGWSLLSPTVFRPGDFSTITHIWLSHEHPDHFSPASLRSIAPEDRARITVLFQQTEDRKVVRFCEDLGFGTVTELPSGEWHGLSPAVRVLCQPFPDHDSWLAVEAEGKVLLNLNDCMARTPEELRTIRRQLPGPVTVLFTQFSFASWVGNRGDTAAQRQAALDHLDRMALQCRELEPRWTVPFASFVRFSHEENAYLNTNMNTVHRAVDHLERTTSTTPVVLYPGDRWEVGEARDSTSALDRYTADYARDDHDLIAPERVTIAELRARAQSFSSTLLGHHGQVRIRLLRAAGVLKPAHIYLADLDTAVALVIPGGLRRSARKPADCDIELSSSALDYILDKPWGGNTLLVNGRFQVPPGGDFERFRRYAALSGMANHEDPLFDPARIRRFASRSAGALATALRRSVRA